MASSDINNVAIITVKDVDYVVLFMALSKFF